MSTYTLDKLKDMRLDRGWSQSALSEMSGLSSRTIQRIEAGKPASIETAKAIAATFEVESIEVLGTRIKTESCTSDPKNYRQPVVFESSYSPKVAEFYHGFLSLVSILALYYWMKSTQDTGSVELKIFNVSVLLIFLVTSGWSLFSLCHNKKDPKARFELKPINPLFVHFGGGSEIGMERYTRKYPLKKMRAVTGVNRENGHLVYHSSSSSTLMVGEEGSGLSVAAICQCFPLFCEQRGGLMLVDSEDDPAFQYVKQTMKSVGRADDLYFAEFNDVSKKDSQWWLSALDERKVLFVRVGKDDDSETVTDAFFSAISSRRWLEHTENNPNGSFLYLKDSHVKDPVRLKEQLIDARKLSGLRSVLAVYRPETFMTEQTPTLVNYFQHKHIMKINDPKVAARLLEQMSVESYSDLKVSDIISHGPGESSYMHSGLVWKKVSMTYLHFPYAE